MLCVSDQVYCISIQLDLSCFNVHLCVANTWRVQKSGFGEKTSEKRPASGRLREGGVGILFTKNVKNASFNA